MTAVAQSPGTPEPKVYTATLSTTSAPPPLGVWAFTLKELSQSSFGPLQPSDIGDVVLLISYAAT